MHKFNEFKVSVCIATYNGGGYLEQQLESIMPQLNALDEIIVSDDGSIDNTLDILRSFKDPRIKVHENAARLGYIKNFEKALTISSGEYIFLCDQDDVWPAGRLERMISLLRDSNKSVLVGNQVVFFESTDAVTRLDYNIKKENNFNGMLNILSILALRRIPYFGCCMLLSKKSLSYILPFKTSKVSHDVWIAIAANCRNDLEHSVEIFLYRRLHGLNLTNSENSGIVKKIITRLRWVYLAIGELWVMKK